MQLSVVEIHLLGAGQVLRSVVLARADRVEKDNVLGNGRRLWRVDGRVLMEGALQVA